MTKPNSNEPVLRKGLCGICPAGCYVQITLENGRIQKVDPDPDHPLGMICEIGKHTPSIVYDPDRLTHPLRRRGPKGSYEFERISWDQAYDILTEKLQSLKLEFGPQSTAIYTGRGAFDLAMCDLLQPQDVAVSSASSILFPFGSPNTLGVGALCYVSFAMIAPHVTMGEMLITMDFDVDQADLIIVWGANPATDSPPLLHTQILKAKQRGADVVVIDPRRNGTARVTEAEWIPIRPGSDGALALAMIQVLIEEELYDEDFAQNWTVGFEELTQLVQHYRPEVASNVTGINPDTIRKLARRIASARGACPIMYTGLEYSDSGVQAIRAVFTLWALAGQMDVPGGLIFKMKENIFPQNRRRLLGNPDMKMALGRDRFPIYSLYRGESHAIALPRSVLEADPYKIQALIILGGSIITAWPNPQLWQKTLASLDFLVTINRYHTADSAYADLVLPAATQYEITSYMRYGPVFKIREKIIDPIGEARSDFLIQSELARRLGYGHLFPQSEEEILQTALEGSGFSLDEVRRAGGEVKIKPVMLEYKKWEKGRLRPDGKPGFNTPSGKFEIASSILQEHGYAPLPVYTEPKEGPLKRPDLKDRFPLIFNSGSRTIYDFRSQHHGVPSLSKKLSEPVVILHTLDAKDRGVQDGDWVWVTTLRGRAKFRARVTLDILRGSLGGAIDAAMGGGGPLGNEAWRKCNVNQLTDLEHMDPISGFPIYKTLLCEIEKAGREDLGDAEPPSHHPDFTEPACALVQKSDPKRRVYLDHNATTPPDPKVVAKMLPFYQELFGNPSSIHSLGMESKSALETARRSLAQALNCTARRIIFTGGGSEANNLAIRGLTATSSKTDRHVITCAVEHPASMQTCQAISKQGFDITILPVDSDGLLDPDTFRRAIRPNTILTTFILANNETGSIQPIRTLAGIARERGVLFHTDAVQAFGKIPLDVEHLGVDALSVSAHKIYGPKGVGALYLRKNIEIPPLIYGGGQEQGLRSGTENIPGIVGFGKACEIAMQKMHAGEIRRIETLRDNLEMEVRKLVPDLTRNGHPIHRLPNTLNLTLPGIRGESLVLAMDRRGVYFSSGSACQSGHPEPSATLLAMGLTEKEAHCSVRFSLGYGNTQQDLDYTLDCLKAIFQETSSTIRFVACR